MGGDGWLHWEELGLLLRVLAAMAIGGVLGWEREAADKPAGLRTHMLVAGTAALLVSLADALVAHAAASAAAERPGFLQLDPTRLIEAVVTGIGFLGAGTIIQHGRKGVEGLTTAASILFTAVLGVTVALDLWVLAVSLALSAVVVLHLLGRLARRLGVANEDA
jgi:putative Mg2+ transporter-C (MgtC) family protein